MHPPSEEFDVSERLPDHALEEILARVPFRDVGATRCVSKRWRAVTTSSTFLALYSARQEFSESRLYVNGFRYRITDSGDDDDETSTTPQHTSEAGDHYSRGAGGVAYSVTDDDRVRYKLSLLDTQWLETPVMPEARSQQPIVAAVTNLARGAHKVIVAGGGTSKEPLSSVCVFDSVEQSWSYCEDLPVEFKGLASSSRSVTAVVRDRKLYLFHIYSGLVASLDVGTKRWSAVSTLRPPGMHYCYLALRRGELLVVGVSHENDRFCFFGWRVDHHTMQCTGPSWPVVCHFGSLKSSTTFGDWQSKKTQASSSSSIVPIATDTLVSLLRRLPACSGIIGFFHSILQFIKAS